MLVQNNTFGFADQGSVNNLNSWARQLKNKYPGLPLYAATSGLKNMRFIAPRLDKGLFEGIMYVYEPNRIVIVQAHMRGACHGIPHEV